ncbi:unnamed protein product, partial [Iphiclides podalirius]
MCGKSIDADIIFTTNCYGNPTLIVNGNRFNREYEKNLKSRWRCVKRNSGCKAFVVTFDRNVVHITDHNHTSVINKNLVETWRCIKRNSGCKATAKTHFGVLINLNNLHNH